MFMCVLKLLSRVRLFVTPRTIYSPWNSPGQNTGVGSRSLLQGIFPTQGSNPGFPHCRQILYQLSHQGSPNNNNDKQIKCDFLKKMCKCIAFEMCACSITSNSMQPPWTVVHQVLTPRSQRNIKKKKKIGVLGVRKKERVVEEVDY